MKPTFLFFTLLTGLSSGLTLPKDAGPDVLDVRVDTPAYGKQILETRADDDWELVYYTKAGSGGQCGGTSSTQSGSGGTCNPVASGKVCVDIKVNLGVASCTFNFIRDGKDCNSGTIASETTVNGGASTTGYNIDDKVMFLSTGCNTK